MVTCKLCNKESEKIFSKIILKKYPADYFKCSHCGFVQTSEPIWIEEAYSSAITSLDIGLLDRNIQLRTAVTKILDACFPEAKIMLDYAGGYGVFVRLMRDAGFNFYREDKFCENIFTKHFDISDAGANKFDVVTAFEVFEHFVNPLEEIEKVLTFSDHLIFSTQLTPANEKELEDWWYMAPETGQHVAFYSPASMELLAKKFNKNYYAKGTWLHLFTSKKLTDKQIEYAFMDVKRSRILQKLLPSSSKFKKQRESLLESDFQAIKNKINS